MIVECDVRLSFWLPDGVIVAALHMTCQWFNFSAVIKYCEPGSSISKLLWCLDTTETDEVLSSYRQDYQGYKVDFFNMGGKKVKLCQTAKLSARRSMRFDDFYWQSDFVIIFYFEAKYFFLMLRYKPVWSYHKQHLCLVSRPDKHFSGLTPTLSLSYWAIYSNKYIT